MAFQISPGVEIREVDLTAIIPAVSTTRAGFAGLFSWGPVDQKIAIASENELVERFGGPDNANYAHWFTAANYLNYSNNLSVVRVVNESTSLNASTNSGVLVKNVVDFESKVDSLASGDHEWVAKYPGVGGNSLLVSVSDKTDASLDPCFGSNVTTGITTGNSGFNSTTSHVTFKHVSTDTAVVGKDLLRFKRGTPQTITGYTAAESLGTIDNVVDISVDASSGATFEMSFSAGMSLAFGDILTMVKDGVRGFARVRGITHDTVDIVEINANGFGFASGTNSALTDEVVRVGAVTTGSTFADSDITVASVLWKYHDLFGTKLPDTSSFVATQGNTGDLLHAVVVDEDGEWTGTKGTVLERFENLTKARNAVEFDGTSRYYANYINDNSAYVWFGDHISTNIESGSLAWGDSSPAMGGSTFTRLTASYYESLSGGTAMAPSGGDYYTNGFDQFEDPETVDVSIILGGPNSGIQANNLVTLVENRKDAVAFFSPPMNAVLNSSGSSPKTASVATANVVAYRTGINGADAGGDVDYTSSNLNVSSSYAVMDNGWKYMYDRYNDVFRYVPLNGDVAGIAVRSDNETETWFSPAGFNRGQVRNVVKLSYNPVRGQRDDLYSEEINPVVSFPGEGTVLFGDKTMQSKPSAFDRINVRRLFIVLEKAIATAAKFQLFEQNDAFTRASFRQLIEPFLRDVQSRRGVTDFKVICDESNNTSEVIDRNEFVADIYIKPTRSINFITLNFVATRTGIDFDEIGGSSA